ncbi:MAG: radical SAM protein [Phycisphaerae bacterium]|nr:radical SAM protein [Phycisphaerae bacterium]
MMKLLLCKPQDSFVEPCCYQYVPERFKGKRAVFSNDIWSAYVHLKKTRGAEQVSIREVDFSSLSPNQIEDMVRGITHLVLFAPLTPVKRLEEIIRFVRVVKQKGIRVIGVLRTTCFHQELIERYPYFDALVASLHTIESLEYYFEKEATVADPLVIENRDIEFPKVFQADASFLEAKEEISLYDYRSRPKWRKQRAISAGTGCPHGCSYCVFQATRPVDKNPEQLVRELAFWEGEVELFHANVFRRRDWLEEVLRRMRKEETRLDIRTLGRIDDMHENMDLFPLCREAGITRIAVGFESADARILRSMRKSQNDLRQLDDIYHEARRNDIFLELNILIGMPEDNEESLQKTLDVMEKYQATFSVSLLRPLPGTTVYKEVLDARLATPEELSLDPFLQGIDMFVDHHPHVPTKHLSKNEMAKWHKRFTDLRDTYEGTVLMRILRKGKRLLERFPFGERVLSRVRTWRVRLAEK